MAQNTSSKNKIVKHESLIPRPKIAGPRVPAENDKILTFAENQTKKILKYCVSWRSSTGTGRMPIEQDQSANDSQDTDNVPLISTPISLNFSTSLLSRQMPFSSILELSQSLCQFRLKPKHLGRFLSSRRTVNCVCCERWEIFPSFSELVGA